jgi:hypothetical protein
MSLKTITVSVICGLAVVLFASTVMAKDLTQRISLGYNQQLSFGILGGAFDDAFLSSQAISSKYWITDRYGVEGLLGFTSAKYEDDRGFGLTVGGKFHANIVMEQNMNFYGGAGLGLMPVSTEVNDKDDNNVGFMAQTFAGFEFFLQGLPNLGFDIEVGLEYVDYDKFQRFGTYGGGFGTFGVRYYF